MAVVCDRGRGGGGGGGQLTMVSFQGVGRLRGRRENENVPDLGNHLRVQNGDHVVKFGVLPLDALQCCNA